MSIEFSSNLPSANESIPANILETYNQHPTALLQTYEFFTQQGESSIEAKNEFLRAATSVSTPEAPSFSYPKLDVTDLMTWRDSLTEMLGDVSNVNLEDEANRLLRENITTRLNEVGIMLLTKQQSEASPDDDKYGLVSWQLQENMREVYGAPSRDEFLPVLGSRLDSIKGVLTASDLPPEVALAADYIRQEFPTKLSTGQFYEPKSETVEWYAEQLIERCAPSIIAVKLAIEEGLITLQDDGKLDSENIVKATRLALEARGYDDWNSQSTVNTNIDTSQANHTIYIPENRKMAVNDFIQVVIGHEIDEHVARRVNGDSLEVPVLGGLGCSDYLQWEEGNGVVNEQLLQGASSLESSAFGYFLSGGLVMGLDKQDAKPRNFGQTFDIVWRLNLLDKYAKNKHEVEQNPAKIKAELMDKAYDQVRRLFRGTDGRVPGVFYPKDAVNYYLGQVKVWQKWDQDMVNLDKGSRIKEHELERSAKINPLRADHRRVAQLALSRI